MSNKVLRNIGVGGGVADTLMETWHSAEAIGTTFGTSNGSLLQNLAEIDERVLIGDLTLAFVVFATWIAIAASHLKRVFPGLEIPILGLGVFGSIVNSALITKYALGAFYTHYHDATSIAVFWQAFLDTDDAAKLGLVMYAVLFVATWIPIFLLVKKRSHTKSVDA